MEKLNKQVLVKIDELIDLVKESTEYKNYLEIRKKLDKNTEIKNLIQEIKQIQQELVKSEYHKDTKKCEILEESLKIKKTKLESFPIYNDYQHAIESLNESLSSIKELEDYLQSITK